MLVTHDVITSSDMQGEPGPRGPPGHPGPAGPIVS